MVNRRQFLIGGFAVIGGVYLSTTNSLALSIIDENDFDSRINNINYDDGFIYFSSNPDAVKVDSEDLSVSGTYTHETENEIANVWSLTHHNGHVYSGDDDDKINKIDDSDMTLVDTYQDDNAVSFIEGGGQHIYACSSNIKKIDTDNMEVVDTFESDSRGVAFNDGFLYAVEEGSCVKIDVSDMSQVDIYEESDIDDEVVEFSNGKLFITKQFFESGIVDDEFDIEIIELDPENMEVIKRFEHDDDDFLRDITYDGEFMYLVNNDFIFQIFWDDFNISSTLEVSSGETNYIDNGEEFIYLNSFSTLKKIEPFEIYSVTIIIENENNEPLENINITIDSNEKETDENGEVSYEVMSGTYEVSIEGNNINNTTENIEVTETTTETYTFEEQEFDVSINVQDENGTELENAVVELGSEIEETNENGEVVFNKMGGEYNLNIISENYDEISTLFTIDNNMNETFSLTLTEYDITVVIVDSNNIIIENAFVELGSETGETNLRGEVRFNKRFGEHDITISADGYEEKMDTVEITGDDTISYTLEESASEPEPEDEEDTEDEVTTGTTSDSRFLGLSDTQLLIGGAGTGAIALGGGYYYYQGEVMYIE